MSLEQATAEYSASREVYLIAYADFLDKVLKLLDVALSTATQPEAQEDIKHVQAEMQMLRDQLGQPPFMQATGTTTTSSPCADSSSPKPSKEFEMRTETKDTTTDEDVKAEVESQASCITGDLIVDNEPGAAKRIVSAFCALRYHQQDFRRLFKLGLYRENMERMSENENNNAQTTNSLVARQPVKQAEEAPIWLRRLAAATIQVVDSGLAEGVEIDNSRLPVWRRLAAAGDAALVARDAAELFESIPSLTRLPASVGREAEAMLSIIGCCTAFD